MHFLPSIWGCLWILVYTRSFITFIDKDKCSALVFGTQEATGTLRYKYIQSCGIFDTPGGIE